MEAPFLERLNWRSDPFAGWFPLWCDRPLCDCGDGCILKSSLMIQTRGRRFFQCANFDQVWSERPKCGCRDRWQVATSFAEQTFRRRYFVCPNVDNDFVVCLTIYKIRY